MIIPNHHFVSTEWFLQEQTEIWHSQWWGVCFASELSEPGAVRPIHVGTMPMMAWRDLRGDIRVFHNRCSHRGVRLVTEPRVQSRISCPYHAWCYDAQGQCVSTPGSDLDPHAHNLTEVRSHSHRDVVWVNVSGTAPPFDSQSWVREWQPQVQHSEWDQQESPVMQVSANWKLTVENYLDTYHLEVVHPDIADNLGAVHNQFFDTDDTWAGMKTQWDPQQPLWCEYVGIFPNVFMGQQQDHSFAIIVTPQSADQHHIRFRLYDDHSASDTASVRSARMQELTGIFSQDRVMIESMHQGRYAPDFHGGVLTEQDPAVARFHRWFMKQVAT